MLRRLAVPVVAGMAVAACVPQVPFSPTAVTLGSGGKVKILQTDCDLYGVVQVEIVGDNGDALIDEKDPRYWRVDFKTPVKIRAFEAGVVPEGGQESVPWHEPARDADLAVYVRTDSGLNHNESFRLEELGEGKFRFQAGTMTREEFEKKAPCALR